MDARRERERLQELHEQKMHFLFEVWRQEREKGRVGSFFSSTHVSFWEGHGGCGRRC